MQQASVPFLPLWSSRRSSSRGRQAAGRQAAQQQRASTIFWDTALMVGAKVQPASSPSRSVSATRAYLAAFQCFHITARL
jgi:hypothetical protein